MLNTTRHVVWQSYFRSLIVAWRSETLIKNTHLEVGVEEWDRAVDQANPITTGNNC